MTAAIAVPAVVLAGPQRGAIGSDCAKEEAK